MAESKEELKKPLMKVKEESGKAGLKLNIQTNKQTNKKPNIQKTKSWHRIPSFDGKYMGKHWKH